MPSPKKGTVSDEIQSTLKATQGSMDWKGDKAGTIRTAIGRVRFQFYTLHTPLIIVDSLPRKRRRR